MEGAMSAIDKAPENKKAEIEKRFDELGAQIKSLKKKKEEWLLNPSLKVRSREEKKKQ